jgi:hypothetical protein
LFGPAVFRFLFIITDICGLRPETGRCRERHIKWFYNGTTSRCERFIYGGCDGNPNKFDTQDECDSFCAEGSGEITVDIDVSGVDSCKYIFCLGECHLYILTKQIWLQLIPPLLNDKNYYFTSWFITIIKLPALTISTSPPAQDQ